MIEVPERTGVDTNVLLATIRTDEPMHSQAQDALRALRVQDVSLVVMPQVIAEFWSVATRPRTARNGLGISSARMERIVTDIEGRFSMLPDHPETYRLWKDLVTRYGVVGASVHDARLVASLLTHGVNVF